MLNLNNKIAVVSGCGSIGSGFGNGRAISTLLARQGANVFGTDINESAFISSLADGFSVQVAPFAPGASLANTPPIVAVLATNGLKSILSLNENSLPVVGDPNTGISCVVIALVFAVLASSIMTEYDPK